MKLLKTIHDNDLGLDTLQPTSWKERTTGRAIVFDEAGNIALLHVTKNHYHKLPGGGVEEGEDVAEALKREVMEEIGCEIMNVRELGVVEEYRGSFFEHQTSHCFIADVKGEIGAPDFTEDEKANGFEVVWLSLDEAIKTLEREVGVEAYEGKFINARELTFLKEAKVFIANISL